MAALLGAALGFITRVLTASVASTLLRVPFAEFLISTASTRSSTVFTAGDTLASDGVDRAARVLLTVFKVGSVLGRAAFLTVTINNTAFSSGIADGFSLAGALRRTVVGSRVPRADGRRGRAFSGVAASTRGLALTSSVVTGSSSFTIVLRLNKRTVSAASLSVDVPLALGISATSGLGGELVSALGRALVVSRDLALRLRSTVGGSTSFTRSNAGTRLRRVHTLRIFVTVISSGVANNTSLLASHLARTKRSFSPDAVSVSSAVTLGGASRARLLAASRRSLPHALRGSVTSSFSTNGRAGSSTGISLGAPHAESIRDTLHLSGVDVEALATTSVVGTPDAHGDGLAITLTVDTSTVLTTHTRVLVPDTARIFTTILRVGVERRASFKALSRDTIPTTALVVVASSFLLVDITRLRALASVGVPLTVVITQASRLTSVSSSTLVVALTRSGVQSAESGSLTVRSRKGAASRGTGLISVVPHTSLVTHATRSRSVTVLTALRALVVLRSSVVETAHGVGSTSLGVSVGVRRRSKLVDSRAITSALVSGLIPHAAFSTSASRSTSEASSTLHDTLVTSFEITEFRSNTFVTTGDGRALLVAAASSRLEEASRITHTISRGNVLGALGLAGTVVEFTFRVSVTSRFLRSVVLVLAAAVTAVKRKIPAAHGRRRVTFRTREEAITASSTGVTLRVPHTTFISRALLLGAVLEAALHATLGFERVPAAHRVGFASDRVRLGRAISSTVVFDGVPDTFSVVVARSLLGPAVRTLLTADFIRPHASSSDVTASNSGELVTVSVTVVGAVVPLTFRIGITLRFSIVVEAALDDTLIIIVVLTHGVSLATSLAAARVSAVLEVASLTAGSFTRLVPHTAVISVTRRTRVIQEFTTASTRIASSIPQASVIRGAPLFSGESSTLTEAATSGTPFAVVVSKAHGLRRKISTALTASSVTEVPHTIRISITSVVVGVFTERTTHVTRPLDVELPAAVVHGSTLRLLFKVTASVVAGSLGSIPHTFVVSLTFRLGFILDITLLVAAVTRGAEALPFTKFISLALGLGKSFVPLAFVSIARLDTLGTVFAPFTVGVGVTRNVVSLTDVSVFTAHATSSFSRVPFTVDIIPAFTIINNLGALLGTLNTDFIPDAPVVIRTRSFIVVTVEAATETEVRIVGLGGTHVFRVTSSVDGSLSLLGVLSRIEASARHHADLVLGVVHTVEVGITSSSSRLSVGVATLHAAENFVRAIDLSLGDHGLDFTTVVGIRRTEGVVVRVASTEALVDVVIELTHGVGVTLTLFRNHLTAALALIERRIPHTFRVTIAIVLGGPAPLALLGTDGSTLAPSTHALSSTSSSRVERPAVLLTSRISSIPHTTVITITSTLSDVPDFTSAQALGTIPGTEVISFTIGSDVGDSSVGNLFVTTTEVAALVLLRSPFTLRISSTGRRSVVTEDTLHVTRIEVPLTKSVTVTEILGEELVTEGRALERFVVPHAILVLVTTKFVAFVFVDALTAASVDGPFTLAGETSTSRRSGETVTGLEATLSIPEAGVVIHTRSRSGVTVFTLTSTDIDSSRGVPFAAVVSVTQTRSPLIVTANTADVTLSRIEDTHGVRVALGDISFFSTTTTARLGVEVPHTAFEFTTAVSIVGKELTIHLADIILPVAHSSFGTASSLGVDFSTSGLALALGVVPHTLLISLAGSSVFSEGVASEALFVTLAVSRVPVTRRVRTAARLITFLGVLEALITAATEFRSPLTLRISSTVTFGAVAVLTLSLTVLRLDVPLTESSTNTVILLEEITELVTFSLKNIPHTVSLSFAVTFSESTIDAILLTLAIDPDTHLGRSTLANKLVSREAGVFSSELVTAVLQTRASSDRAIPHAPTVSITSGGSSVLVTTLLTARLGRRIPFALVPRTTVRFVAEVAETAAVALDVIPFTSLAGVTVSLSVDHVARTTAGSTVDSISLVPVAFLIERTGSGVFCSGVGANEVAVFTLALASFIGSPFAHTTTSLQAERFGLLEVAINTALSRRFIPHATIVLVTTRAIEVSRRAVINTLVLDKGTSSISSTVLLADSNFSSIVVAETRVAALGLLDVPLTFSLLITIGFIEVAVRALIFALALVEFTHFNDGTSG